MAAIAGSAAVVVGTASAAAVPFYTAQRIELPPSYRPTGFNAAGDTAGYKVLAHEGRYGTEQLAYRQRAGAAAQVFADLPGGDRHGSLLALNDAGVAVGFGSGPDDPAHRYGGVYYDDIYINGARAQLLTADGQRRDLSAALPAGTDSLATAVNTRGDVAGSYFVWSASFGSFVARPFVWSEDEGMRLPFADRRGDVPITAAGINDAGHIVGTIYDAYDVGNTGFVWDGVATHTIRGRIGRARAINNHDQVVGVDAFYKAFVWTRADGKVMLPMLVDKRSAHCDALDINDGGVIVGVCRDVPVAWYPQPGGGYAIADLRAQIERPDGVPLGRYGRGEAVKIDSAGRILLRSWRDRWFGADDIGFSAILTPRP